MKKINIGDVKNSLPLSNFLNGLVDEIDELKILTANLKELRDKEKTKMDAEKQSRLDIEAEKAAKKEALLAAQKLVAEAESKAQKAVEAELKEKQRLAEEAERIAAAKKLIKEMQK